MTSKFVNKAGTQTYHYPLDVMRFAAAVSVMAFHLTFYSWASTQSSTAHALARATAFPSVTPWTWFGWVGVEVFFVISGFVIANSAAGVSARAFLKSRVLRLLPAAWICATITLFVREAGGLDVLGALVGPYLGSLTLWPPGPWLDGVYWSLGVEISFYGLIFVLLCIDGFRRLPAVAWTLSLASGAFLLVSATGLDRHVPGWRLLAPAAELLLLKQGALFAVGIWLWLSSERRLKLGGVFGLALAAAVACLEIWVRGRGVQVGEAPAAAGQPLLAPIVIWLAMVALLLVVTRWPARFVPRSDRVRAGLRRAGLATYPLYLLHNVLGASLIRAMVHAGVNRWVALLLAILLAVSTAFFVALVLEPRVRRALRAAIERLEQWRAPPRGAVAPSP